MCEQLYVNIVENLVDNVDISGHRFRGSFFGVDVGDDGADGFGVGGVLLHLFLHLFDGVATT